MAWTAFIAAGAFRLRQQFQNLTGTALHKYKHHPVALQSCEIHAIIWYVVWKPFKIVWTVQSWHTSSECMWHKFDVQHGFPRHATYIIAYSLYILLSQSGSCHASCDQLHGSFEHVQNVMRPVSCSPKVQLVRAHLDSRTMLSTRGVHKCILTCTVPVAWLSKTKITIEWQKCTCGRTLMSNLAIYACVHCPARVRNKNQCLRVHTLLLYNGSYVSSTRRCIRRYTGFHGTRTLQCRHKRVHGPHTAQYACAQTALYSYNILYVHSVL